MTTVTRKLSLHSFKSLSPEKQKELDRLKVLQQRAEKADLSSETNKHELSEQDKRDRDQAIEERQKRHDQPTTREEVVEAMAWLIKTYPKLFTKKHNKPLMMGVHNLIVQDQGDNFPYSKSLFRKALRMYVNHPLYLKALVQSDHRFTLQGDIAGPIDENHKQDAKDRIQQRQKKRKHSQKKSGQSKP